MRYEAGETALLVPELEPWSAFGWGALGGVGAVLLFFLPMMIALYNEDAGGALKPKRVSGFQRAGLGLMIVCGVAFVGGVAAITIGATAVKFAVSAGAAGDAVLAGIMQGAFTSKKSV